MDTVQAMLRPALPLERPAAIELEMAMPRPGHRQERLYIQRQYFFRAVHGWLTTSKIYGSRPSTLRTAEFIHGAECWSVLSESRLFRHPGATVLSWPVSQPGLAVVAGWPNSTWGAA